MMCSCDEFLVASKLQMIKLKYHNASIPEELVGFFQQPEKYSRIEFGPDKRLWKWQNFSGAKKTNYGANIEATPSDGTLKVFQTFYICERCAKVYWDGGHYHNNCGGKLDFIFDLFPEADDDT
jgi:Mut7-C RNAse domain